MESDTSPFGSGSAKNRACSVDRSQGLDSAVATSFLATKIAMAVFISGLEVQRLPKNPGLDMYLFARPRTRPVSWVFKTGPARQLSSGRLSWFGLSSASQAA